MAPVDVHELATASEYKHQSASNQHPISIQSASNQHPISIQSAWALGRGRSPKYEATREPGKCPPPPPPTPPKNEMSKLPYVVERRLPPALYQHLNKARIEKKRCESSILNIGSDRKHPIGTGTTQSLSHGVGGWCRAERGVGNGGRSASYGGVSSIYWDLVTTRIILIILARYC